MHNFDKIHPILQAFDVSESACWTKTADESDAICFMYGKRMISIKLGNHRNTIGLYVHEKKVNPFDLSIDFIPIELTAEMEDYYAFLEIRESENFEQKVGIYVYIIEKYAKRTIIIHDYFEKLKVFYKGFLVGNTL